MKKGKLKERNITMCILLSMLTLGLYDIYWLIMLIKETGYFSRGNLVTSTKVLLTIVTCGLYGLVWANDVGTDLYYAGKSKKVKIADKSVLYILLLSISIIIEMLFDLPIEISLPIKNGLSFNIGIISFPAPFIIMLLVQNDLNKLARK